MIVDEVGPVTSNRLPTTLYRRQDGQHFVIVQSRDVGADRPIVMSVRSDALGNADYHGGQLVAWYADVEGHDAEAEMVEALAGISTEDWPS